MIQQLSLFATGIECSHCKTDPGYKSNNNVLWDGFQDMDTGEMVCKGCRKKHYQLKSKSKFAFMYSEMPVVVKSMQHDKISIAL